MADKRIDRAVEELETLTDKLRTDWAASAGPCHQCRYAVNSNGLADWNNYPQWYHCHNPLVSKPTFDPVLHRAKHQPVPCATARFKTGLCGPTGTLFEQKKSPAANKAQSFWSWLMS